LWLAPECPYPMYGGGALRAASVLEYLARHYEVDAVLFREPRAPDPQASLPDGLVRDLLVVDLPYHSRTTLARALRNVARLARDASPLVDRFAGFGRCLTSFLNGRRYALGVIEHFWCAPYWEQIALYCQRTVLNLHNIDSEWHARAAAATSGARSLAHRRFRNSTLDLERQWLPRYSLVLAASHEDAVRASAIAPQARIAVYPNAIPRVERPRSMEEDVIIFSGSFEYEPNRAAVRFFRRSIWPRLRERWPHLRWRLVGRNPEAVRRFTEGDRRIECTGPVDDAVSHLARAKVVVVPLLTGSGTRLKIIEAWAAARAVVSTTLGAEGLPAKAGQHLLLEDAPGRFAEAVSRLLQSPEQRERLGKAGRELYLGELTWQAAWTKLAAVLRSL